MTIHLFINFLPIQGAEEPNILRKLSQKRLEFHKKTRTLRDRNHLEFQISI